MGMVIQSVANYAPWIYAICGLVALYQLYKIWAVRAERKQAAATADANRARFGRSKAERDLSEQRRMRELRLLDQHRIDGEDAS